MTSPHRLGYFMIGQDSKWLNAPNAAIYDRDTLTLVVLIQAAAVKLDSLVRWMSYRCVSWVMSERGFKMKQDLTGTDQPKSIFKLKQSASNWLN
jgi:hypothetical protein